MNMHTDYTRWVHAICDACWDRLCPGQVPHRTLEPKEEVCCYCDRATSSGIYTRGDPLAVHAPRRWDSG